jgi:hypothetical protein
MGTVTDIRFKLAIYIHEFGMRWVKHILNNTDPDLTEGSTKIPPYVVETLLEQLNTPYNKLSPRTQKFNLEQADKIIDIVLSNSADPEN